MADIDLSDLTGPAPDVDLSDLETEISPVVVEGRPLRWRDVPVEAIQNIPESGGRLVKGLWETVKHPIKTGAALVDLAAGAQSLIPGWEPPRNLREFQDQADSINLGREWANRSREKKGLPLLPMVTTQELQQQFIANRERQRGMARSVWQDLVDRYGSADALKYTLARDPVGALADVATLAIPGGAAAKGAQAAGMARTANVLTRGAKAVEMLDPVNLALKGGSAVAKGAGRAIPVIAGVTPGTGGEALAEATRAGFEGGQRGQTFRRAMAGEATPEQVVSTAEQALASMREQRAAEYRSGMYDISQDKTVLPFNDINRAVQSAFDVGRYKGVPVEREAATVQAKIDQVVQDWSQLNPTDYHTPEGMDALKRAIGDIRLSTDPNTPGRVVADRVYNAVKSEIVKQAPVYAEVMKDYEKASDALRETAATLSLRPERGTVDTAYRRLASTMRGTLSDAGQRETLLSRLDAESGGQLKPLLAGALTSDWLRPGKEGLPITGLGGVLAGLAGGAPAAAGALAAASPRAVGEVFYRAGQLGGLAAAPITAGQKFLAGTPLAGPVGELSQIPLKANILSQAGEMTQTPEERRALIERYRRPVETPPPPPPPEEAQKLHPELQQLLDEADAAEQTTEVSSGEGLSNEKTAAGPRTSAPAPGEDPVFDDLSARVLRQESGGDPEAVSPKGAKGLMQVMDATARAPGMGVEPMRDNTPDENVRFGRDYLYALLRKFNGDRRLALMSYNWGIGKVQKWLSEGANPDRVPEETRNYVGAILGTGF